MYNVNMNNADKDISENEKDISEKTKGKKKNPHGANNTTRDPRQDIFWKLFIPKFEKGIENAYQTAIEAGYEETSARTITVTRWYIEGKEKLSSKTMLDVAEKRLRQYLGFEPIDQEGKIDHQLMTNQFKAMQLILKGLGKDKYSERQEVTGKNGKDLPIPILGSLKIDNKDYVHSNNSTKKDSEAKKED